MAQVEFNQDSTDAAIERPKPMYSGRITGAFLKLDEDFNELSRSLDLLEENIKPIMGRPTLIGAKRSGGEDADTAPLDEDGSALASELVRMTWRVQDCIDRVKHMHDRLDF